MYFVGLLLRRFEEQLKGVINGTLWRIDCIFSLIFADTTQALVMHKTNVSIISFEKSLYKEIRTF